LSVVPFKRAPQPFVLTCNHGEDIEALPVTCQVGRCGAELVGDEEVCPGCEKCLDEQFMAILACVMQWRHTLTGKQQQQ